MIMTEVTAAAAEPSVVGSVISTTKAIVLSPIFGVAMIGGIIAYQWWKGKKDAEAIKPAKS
jgi:hypothetical protein